MKLRKLIAVPTALALTLAFAFGAFGFAAPSAEAQVTGPRLAIQLLNTGLTSPLTADSNDAVVARLVLDTTASSEAVRISSLPYILSMSAGADVNDLENCEVINESGSTVLADNITLISGMNNVALDSALVLPANTVTTLALRCDVGTNLVANSTYTFSMNTANVSAVGAITGVTALVTVRGAVIVPPVYTPVPGLPTTGATGDTQSNVALMLGAGLLAVAGLAMTRKQTYNRA